MWLSFTQWARREATGRGRFFATILALSAGCTLEHSGPWTTPPPMPPGAEDCTRVADAPDTELPVWDLYLDRAGWDELHEDVEAKVGVDATLCIDGKRHPIQLELQGASTRHAAKKSFDLKFKRGVLLESPFVDEHGRPVDEPAFDRMVIKAMARDHSLIRETLAFDMWRQMGRRGPRTSFANLRINGAYWGLYEVVEPIDEDFLERHGYPDGGRLYKAVRKHGEFADFAPGRDLERAFEFKSDDDPDAYEDLERLVETLQRTPLDEASYLATIDPIFPLDQYLDRMIWVSFTQNGDATAQNFFLYDAPKDGHDFWYLLPWDSNLCLGADWRDPDDVRSPAASPLLDGRNHFGRRLVRVDGIRERYVERYRRLMDEVLTEDVVMGNCQGHADAVAHDLALDQERWDREVDPQTASNALFDFLAERPAALREGLDELLREHGEPADESDEDGEVDEDDAPRVAGGGDLDP